MAERTRRRKKPVKQAVESRKVVTKKYKLEGEEVDEPETVELQVHEFVSDPAYIRAAAGVTKSIGQYESLRVDVAITMPCYPEEVITVYNETAERVSELLATEVDNYLYGEEEE